MFLLRHAQPNLSLKYSHLGCVAKLKLELPKKQARPFALNDENRTASKLPFFSYSAFYVTQQIQTIISMPSYYAYIATPQLPSHLVLDQFLVQLGPAGS